MSTLHKKSFLISFSLAILLICSCFYAIPTKYEENNSVAAMSADKQIILAGADTFGQSGLFIKKPENALSTNSYWGSVTNDLLNPTNFNPEYKAVKKVNDTWADVDNDDFKIELEPDKISVRWKLSETASLQTYGIICKYYQSDEDYKNSVITQNIFQILYTDSWTFVSAKNLYGENLITNFFGKTKSLTLLINYNNGATIFSTLEPEIVFPNGAAVGRISKSEIVCTENFLISMTTLSGETYPPNLIHKTVSANSISLLFDQTLNNEKYILKIYSPIDDKVYGQFIIDNSGSGGGINLSNAWVFLVAFGGLFILAGVIAFFAPVILRKVNENKVYKENLRIAKIKNPDAYVEKSGTIFDRIKKKFKKMKNQAVEPEIEKPKVENSDRVKFTDVIRENREKRDFMEQHGITTDKLEEMKNQENAIKNAEKNSFAFLRDDDEIASLYEEKVEAPTIATGAYVKDGVRFSKLDSVNENNEEEDDSKND